MWQALQKPDLEQAHPGCRGQGGLEKAYAGAGGSAGQLDLAGSRKGRKGLSYGNIQIIYRSGLKFQPGHSPALGLGRGTPSPKCVPSVKEHSEGTVARIVDRRGQDVGTRPASACPALPHLSRDSKLENSTETVLVLVI